MKCGGPTLLALGFCALTLSATSTSSSAAEPSPSVLQDGFPVYFEVSPDCRLFFHGVRLADALVTFENDSTLWINGRRWIPPGTHPLLSEGYEVRHILSTEEDMLRRYSEVPGIQRSLAEGLRIDAASALYQGRTRAIRRRLATAYTEAADAGVSHGEAIQRALREVASTDTMNLLDPQCAANPDTTSPRFSVRFAGMRGFHRILPLSICSDSQGTTVRTSPRLTPEKALDHVMFVKRHVGIREGRAGVMLLPGRGWWGGEENVRKADAQVDAAVAAWSPRIDVSGPLNPIDLACMLANLGWRPEWGGRSEETTGAEPGR